MSFFKKLLGYNTQTTNLLNIPTNEQIFNSYRYPYKENVYLRRRKRSQKTKKQKSAVPKIVERTTFASEANRQTYRKLRAEGLPPDKIVFQSNFTNVANIARKQEEKERKKMLGNLFRSNIPVRYTPRSNESVEEPASVIQSRRTSTNGEEPTQLVETPKSPFELNINWNRPNTPEEEAILYGKGGKRTRKHKSRRSTKRRGSRSTRKH